MSTLTSLAIFLLVLVLAAVSAALYLLPTLIGWARHVPNIGSVAAVNALLGWTLVGWAVALAMALRTANTGAVIQVVNHPPMLPPPTPPTVPPAQTPRHARGAPPLQLPPRPPGQPPLPPRNWREDW